MEKKENGTQQELVERPEQPLIVSEGLLTDDMIIRAEKQVEGIKKIKILSIRVTNELDWVNQQGNPYLQNSGCMKVAQLFGINFIDRNIEEDKRSDDIGDYIIFTCKGTATIHDRKVQDIGTCSTRDDFFGKKGGNYKPLAEVDLENVKKKAVTNWQGRILKKILGLKFTWEDLQLAGLDKSKITEIKYANGGKGGGKISEAQGKRLWAITKKSGKTEEDLKKYLKEKFDVEHSKDIERKDYDTICMWAGLPKGG